MALWAEKLVFVYNTDSRLVSEAREYLTRLVAPQAHACHLTFLTHDTVGVRPEWKEFIAELGTSAEFLHRDEFAVRYPNIMTELPAVLQQVGGDLSVLITAREIAACATLGELEAAIRHNLAER